MAEKVPKRGDVCAVGAILEPSKFCRKPQMLDMELEGLMFALMGFGLALVWSLLVMSWNGNAYSVILVVVTF